MEFVVHAAGDGAMLDAADEIVERVRGTSVAKIDPYYIADQNLLAVWTAIKNW